jgi:hypothetical protein
MNEGKVTTVPSEQNPDRRYGGLIRSLNLVDPFVPVLLDDGHYFANAPMGPDGSERALSYQRDKRHVYRKHLALNLNAATYSYTPGGNHIQLCWVWKRPGLRGVPLSDTDATAEARLLAGLQSGIPVYHSRAMNASAELRFRQIPQLSPAILRAMRRSYSDDASAPHSKESAEIEARIFDYISKDGEPAFYYDLRALNHRPEKFDEFWKFANSWIADKLRPAVDDRRHEQRQGAVLNASVALSIPDMLRQIQASWKDEHGAGELEVPCASFVAAAFYPGHPCHAAAARYSGKLNLCRVVQRRCLRHEHEDAHYNHAEQKYAKVAICLLRDAVSSNPPPPPVFYIFWTGHIRL